MSPDSRSPDPIPWWSGRRGSWIAGAVIVAGTVAAYSNTLHVQFMFDDYVSIPDNASLRDFRTWLSPPITAGVGGRPLLNLTFGLNYAIGGVNPLGYHLVNLAVHVASALLVFGILQRTLERPVFSKAVGAEAGPLALGLALLWALHPLQTEAVTYVSQRAESLAGLFAFATLGCFVRGLDSPRQNGWLAGSVAACLAAMAVKETVILLPVVIGIYDRMFVAGTWRECWRARSRYYLGLAGTWVFLGWLMRGSNLSSRGVGFDFGISALLNLVIACGAVARYLRLTLWPQGLVFDYGNLAEMGPFSGWGRLVPIAVMLVAVVLAARRWPWLWFPACWFAAFLAPTTGVVPVLGQPVAEHRVYLALLGPLGVVVGAGFAWRSRWAVALALGLAAAAGVASHLRNADYRSTESIWRRTLERLPENPRAHDQLARAIATEGRFDEALAIVREGLTFRPQDGQLHLTNGHLLQHQGNTEQAILAGRAAAALMPENLPARVLLYRLYGASNDLPNARKQLEAACDLDRNDGHLRADLCYILRQLGQREAAVRAGEEAVRLAPDYDGAHGNLAMALIDVGRVAPAVAQHAAWLKLQPVAAPPNHEFALALIKAGALAEAEAELEETLLRSPDDPDAFNHLGVVRAARGDRGKAQAAFERALQLRPGHQEAAENLRALGTAAVGGGSRSP